VPEISRFFGIVVKMFFGDLDPVAGSSPGRVSEKSRLSRL